MLIEQNGKYEFCAVLFKTTIVENEMCSATTEQCGEPVCTSVQGMCEPEAAKPEVDQRFLSWLENW
jgi:hypothetical protein